MKRPSRIFTIAVIALVLLAAMVAGGCRTAKVDQFTNRYDITSEPNEAAVVDQTGRRVGTTPMTVENRFEIKRQEVPTSIGASLTFGGVGLMGLGGWTLGEFASSEDRSAGLFVLSGLTIFAGLASTTMGAVSWAGVFDSTSYRIVGAERWTPHDSFFSEPSPQQVERWLFPSPRRVTAPGYQAQQITPQDGHLISVELAPEGSQRRGSTTVYAISDAPKGPKQADPSSPADDSAKPDFISASPQPSAFALVVGVGDYRDVTDADGARADAERFAGMLEASMGLPPKQIRLLTDARATRSDILSQVTWLKENVPEGSRIYFFFAGHGTPHVDTGHSYILPHEANPDLLVDTGIELKDLLSRLGESQAREILAFVDSCFSGSGGRSVLPRGTRPMVPVTAFAKTPRVALFSAAQASQISGNFPGKTAGLFTEQLLEGLGKGRADADGNGQLTLAELHDFVQPRVERIASEASRSQTPQLTVAEELGASDGIVVTWGLPLQ